VKYKDYYAALGVPRDADLDSIKKAYRKLARQYHPDVSKASDAEARFKDAAEAYATLKNPEKRAAYDELGRRPAGAEFSPPPNWRDEHDVDLSSFENLDLAELLAALGRQQGHGASGPRPVHGQDFEDTVHINLVDAHRGTTLNLNLAEPGGTRTLEVRIPAGVVADQKLRLRGKGGKGRNGGSDGDLYLHIAIAPHPIFRADRHDLFFDLVLAPWEAALGAELEVPTIDGSVMLTVPPGTRSGRKLRLRGRGLADRHGGRGDLYALVSIDVPAALTAQEHDLFEQLAAISTFQPRNSVHKEAA
jgi:curved DNA-binding protein